MTSPTETIPPYSIARLRRSAVAFLLAKTLTAPVSLMVFLLISGWLPKAEFALYAWLLAFGQVAEWVSYVGINWVAVHYIPLYRTRIGGRACVRFVWNLIAIRYALLALIVISCYFAAPAILAIFGQRDWLRPLHLYLVVMAIDISVRFLRLSILEPLLEQGAAQRNVLLQHVVVLGLLFSLSRGSSLSIEQVLLARVAATVIAWGAALARVAWLLRSLVNVTPEAPAPSVRTLLGFALNNYTQDLVRILSDGPMVTLFASTLVGLSGLAQFGFAGNLADYLSRVLPTTLFLGLLRPRLIADYGRDGAFERLRDRVALLLKISMALLAAVAAVLAAAGRPALGLLYDGKYSGSYGLLFLFLWWLGLGAVRMMQGALTNVVGHSHFLRRAAASSLIVVPAAAALVAAGAGPQGLVLGMIVGEALWVWLVARQLRRQGYGLQLDVPGYVRLLAATVISALAGKAAALLPAPAWWSVGLVSGVAIAAFALAIRTLRPFDQRERSTIERVAGCRVVLL